MLTDTHAHLYWDSFKEDLEEMLQRTVDSGVTSIINVGVDVEKSQKALDQTVILSKATPKSDSGHGSEELTTRARMKFYSTIGIHPHEAWRYSSENNSINHELLQNDINSLEKIYQSNPQKVVAVGECGVDYFFGNNPDLIPSSLSDANQKDLQKKLLQAQINLARKLNLPLIIHVRDDRSKNPQNSECWDEAIEMTKDHFGIYHCYSGLPQTTSKILSDTSFLISFAATLTYPKNEYLRETIKIIPLERIVLETDCPFLPPQSDRGKRNEPKIVREIAQLIAELKGISFEEVAHTTTENVKRLLQI